MDRSAALEYIKDTVVLKKKTYANPVRAMCRAPLQESRDVLGDEWFPNCEILFEPILCSCCARQFTIADNWRWDCVPVHLGFFDRQFGEGSWTCCGMPQNSTGCIKTGHTIYDRALPRIENEMGRSLPFLTIWRILRIPSHCYFPNKDKPRRVYQFDWRTMELAKRFMETRDGTQ